MRQTEDSLIRNLLQASAGFVNCVNGVNGDSPTELTLPDIQNVIRILQNNSAETLMNNIDAEDRFGTGPIRWAYLAMMHTNVIPNLEAVDNFLHASQYPSTQKVIQSEWGNVNNIRFLVSPIAAVVTNSSMLGADVYQITVVANEAYGIVKQDGYTNSFVYRPPIFSDPLAQNSSAGWKMATCPVLFNDQFALNLNCTVS